MRNFTFENQLKLKTSKQYSEVFNTGRKFNSSGIVIYFKPDTLLKTGIIASRKIDKRAVIRNRTKRIIREIFRLHKPTIDGHYVIIAKRKMLTMNYTDIVSDFKKAISKIAKQYDK